MEFSQYVGFDYIFGSSITNIYKEKSKHSFILSMERLESASELCRCYAYFYMFNLLVAWRKEYLAFDDVSFFSFNYL